jgi:phospholipid transport system substrate-binding protein
MWTWRACLVAGGILVSLAGAGAAGDGPREVVGRLNAALLDVLRHADELGYEGRFDRLKPVMRDTFDLPFMAEKSLGLAWKRLDEADRDRWIAVFGDFTVANFAANFDRYTGQTFELLGEEPAASDTRLVRTRVASPGAANVDFAYRLRPDGGRWSIVDVYLEGTVSELALRRSEYASALEHGSFDALLDTVRGKIADLAAGRAKRKHV